MSREEYQALVADVRERGILSPLDITEGGVVLDGRHRLQAATELGLGEVPVRLVAPADELDYMLSMAIERRHLSAGQKALLALERDEYRRARAEAEGRKTEGSNELRATLPEAERPREIVARLAGTSARTVQDAITVRDADPELAEQVRSGRLSVASAARQVRRERMLAGLATPPLPTGPFAVVYADPPWQSRSPSSDRAAENHYPTMAVEELKALPVPAADDAVCFLWAVNPLLPAALEVLAAWGFSYRSNLVWVKDKLGLGSYVRGQHELLLLGTRGEMPAPAEPDRPPSVIVADRQAHSVKPAAVPELIERMYPGLSRVELFAREEREGWVGWGNELAEPPREREVG
jgi:N6-adenosine-specific RNA methylase IME4